MNIALVAAPSHLRVLLVKVALTESICLALHQGNTVVLCVMINARWLSCLSDYVMLQLH